MITRPPGQYSHGDRYPVPVDSQATPLTVFGEGTSKAMIMIAGKQPGDQEDRVVVHVSWPAVLRATLISHVALDKEFLMAIVAVLGITISPYLFFWRASQEVEEVRANRGEKALKHAPAQASPQLERIRTHT